MTTPEIRRQDDQKLPQKTIREPADHRQILADVELYRSEDSDEYEVSYPAASKQIQLRGFILASVVFLCICVLSLLFA